MDPMKHVRTTVLVGLLVVAVPFAATSIDHERSVRPDHASDRAPEPTSSSLERTSSSVERTERDTFRPATGLDPGLQAAFERARRAAEAAGHTLVVNSGWRSPERQQQLLDQEIRKRGSVAAATRWVFPPDRSMHVRGLAIDVGDGGAADWLKEHGARFGLCHTLAWEWWHFEWRARWEASGSCPAEADDPSEAPGP